MVEILKGIYIEREIEGGRYIKEVQESSHHFMSLKRVCTTEKGNRAYKNEKAQ